MEENDKLSVTTTITATAAEVPGVHSLEAQLSKIQSMLDSFKQFFTVRIAITRKLPIFRNSVGIQGNLRLSRRKICLSAFNVHFHLLVVYSE